MNARPMNTIRTGLTALALVAVFGFNVYAYASEIVWDQPEPVVKTQQGLHENLNFEGNATLTKSDVTKLQTSLKNKGFYKGRIDGLWGGQTTQALLDYQATNQQAMTGTVTFGTLKDLGVNVDARRY